MWIAYQVSISSRTFSPIHISKRLQIKVAHLSLFLVLFSLQCTSHGKTTTTSFLILGIAGRLSYLILGIAGHLSYWKLQRGEMPLLEMGAL